MKGYYKGLKIRAHPDLHKVVINEILKLNLDENIDILIVAGGTGAFEQRLYDNGFKNIDSIEIDIENYKFNKINNLYDLNLNRINFFNKINKKYDLIIALEIIEHLYSPFFFLKEFKKLIRNNNSIVIISTPNLHNIFSRINNIFFGLPSYFIVKPEKYGHISPIYINIFEFYIDELNLKIEKHMTKNCYLKHFTIHSFRSYFYLVLMLFLFPLVYIFSFFNRKYLFGSNNIFIIKRK